MGDFGGEPNLENHKFASVLPEGTDLPFETLLELTGSPSLALPTVDSGLTRRVARTWVKSMRELTCAEVSMLVGQKFGLEWLAKPVAIFARLNPIAECRFYPGDLTFVALEAHNQLLEYAPTETRDFLNGSFGWIDDAYSFEKLLPAEARSLLIDARRAANLN